MAMNIGQTFLQDAEKNQLTIPGWPFQVFWNLAPYVKAATAGEPFGEPAGGGRYAGLVQQWWVKQVRGGANFLQSRIGKRIQVIDQDLQFRSRLFDLADQGNRHLHRGDRLTGGVVQLTRDVPALFVLNGHQA